MRFRNASLDSKGCIPEPTPEMHPLIPRDAPQREVSLDFKGFFQSFFLQCTYKFVKVGIVQFVGGLSFGKAETVLTLLFTGYGSNIAVHI